MRACSGSAGALFGYLIGSVWFTDSIMLFSCAILGFIIGIILPPERFLGGIVGTIFGVLVGYLIDDIDLSMRIVCGFIGFWVGFIFPKFTFIFGFVFFIIYEIFKKRDK